MGQAKEKGKRGLLSLRIQIQILTPPDPRIHPSLSWSRSSDFISQTRAMLSRSAASQLLSTDDDDDDFQIPPTLTLSGSLKPTLRKNPLKPSDTPHPPFKKPKRHSNREKQNAAFFTVPITRSEDLPDLDDTCSLDLIPSSVDCSFNLSSDQNRGSDSIKCDEKREELLEWNEGYLCNSLESRLIRPTSELIEEFGEDFEEDNGLDDLLKLCNEVEEEEKEINGLDNGSVQCPLCGVDISDLNEEQRLVHTNDCLDKVENPAQPVLILPSVDRELQCPPEVIDGPPLSPPQVVDVSPVVKWLSNLGLARYADAFVREEVDWDTLKWLTEEDLFSIGVTALGPRKKIVHALSELRKGCSYSAETHVGHSSHENESAKSYRAKMQTEISNVIDYETSKPAANKLITDFFPGLVSDRKKVCAPPRGQNVSGKGHSDSSRRCVQKNHVKNTKLKDIPTWCCIPGTPFRVDAFKYLRGDCSYWFLTHFHMDHYQGLTKSFRHGKIYCSSITARLVNMKLGIPWEMLQVLPLNQKINVSGIDVTCLDANHCPGSIMILFEPPNGKAVLHTGDFRFSEEMAVMSLWHACPIHTLILDTTYCNPQYDFPKQEAVIQFVIEAIQAEAFNPKTLFLIGSYTIGKERLFLEVARVLRRKVYITTAKLRLLECLGFSEEDMQWFTCNEQESQIHVVPMWTLASFKRLKHISNQYASRFSLIVAFSPTGWTVGKGKKKSPGRRWQQGTIIRYEVPYSEHCSFTELREFVKLLSPETIIPSVNNDGPDSAKSMISLLLP
ncbi:DNA cross-link repair protein SNM1 [Durio zibethinus]|uniref:DNA cross-link repair protein SNM1 n=1 Tax=Durio zibethinus TaxID=66656 RepID=A0A6P5XKZ2_DURZI|nr:DNA cross-link repair protein SNM1 [Durio zibethinus]